MQRLTDRERRVYIIFMNLNKIKFVNENKKRLCRSRYVTAFDVTVFFKVLATRACGLQLLVYEALKLLVYEALRVCRS
jgi:hypothetical protein